MRLIDADELHRIYQNWINDCDAEMEKECGAIEDCMWELDAQPTIDPVKHGRWVEKKRNYGICETWIECSLCGYPTTKMWGNEKYCPNCGAKMDEEDSND